MPGHVQDRWFKTVVGPDGKPRKEKTRRHGSGLRYRARFVLPDGRERSQSFPDRQKRSAQDWLTQLEADLARGQFIDPKAARTTFRDYAERWVSSQTTDLNTRAAVERQLRRHAIPYLGAR